MNRILLTILISIISITLLAQSCSVDYDYIDKNDLKNYIEILASDSLDGRYTGSIGQKKAAHFLAREYENIGLEKFTNDSYFECFNVESSKWNEVYIKTDTEKLINNVHISYIGSAVQQTEKEVYVVFGGYGSKKELNQIQVKDKLVLIFSDNMRNYYSITDKLIQRQAYGVILANPNNDKQFAAIRNSTGNYRAKDYVSLPSKDTLTNTYFRFFKDFIISNEYIKNLIGLSINKLKNFAENDKLVLCPSPKVKIKVEKSRKNISTENVVGILPGKTDTSIIISAHYDHLGRKGDVYYPGADDNASGTSALLELAETFSKMNNRKYTMIFLAATGEEEGLFGSYVHANSEIFNPEKVLINLNMDMISRNDEDHSQTDSYLFAIGIDIYSDFKPVFEKADSLFSPCSFDYKYNNGDNISWLYRASDQYSFHKKGIPGIFFFTGLHDDYHQPTDTPEKINYDVLTNRIKLIAHVIDELQK
jgi:hypothetical protein